MAEPVSPERLFAVEMRSLWNAVRRGEPLTPVDVLEQIARAADAFAEATDHARKGVPIPTLSDDQIAAIMAGAWVTDDRPLHKGCEC